MIDTLWKFTKLTRIPFLLGGILLYNLGVCLAYSSGTSINLFLYWLGQATVTISQWMAQYTNEVYDLETDRLNASNRTWFSGGSGILPSESIPLGLIQKTINIQIILGLIGCLVASYFVPVVFPIIIISILGSYYYSAPPIRLVASGTGELVASVIVSVFVPLTGYLLQAPHFSPDFVWILTPLLLIHMSMLVAFQIPDYEADRKSKKNTLAVRMGLRMAGLLNAGLILLALAILLLEYSLHYHFAFLSPYLLPFALLQILFASISIRHPSHSFYQWLTISAVSLLALTSLSYILGILTQ